MKKKENGLSSGSDHFAEYNDIINMMYASKPAKNDKKIIYQQHQIIPTFCKKVELNKNYSSHISIAKKIFKMKFSKDWKLDESFIVKLSKSNNRSKSRSKSRKSRSQISHVDDQSVSSTAQANTRSKNKRVEEFKSKNSPPINLSNQRSFVEPSNVHHKEEIATYQNDDIIGLADAIDDHFTIDLVPATNVRTQFWLSVTILLTFLLVELIDEFLANIFYTKIEYL